MKDLFLKGLLPLSTLLFYQKKVAKFPEEKVVSSFFTSFGRNGCEKQGMNSRHNVCADLGQNCHPEDLCMVVEDPCAV